MQQAVKSAVADARLTLAEVLGWLVEDRLVAPEAAEALKTERRYHRGNVHPLCVVAEKKWKKGTSLLTLDALSEWLAKRLGMESLHIDPLKIDFTAVKSILSGSMWRYSMPRRLASHSERASSVRSDVPFFHFCSATTHSGCTLPRW